MLHLSDTTPFASGDFRDCYRHPQNPSRCVKIVRAMPPDHHLGRADWLLGRTVSDPNRREYQEYWRLKSAGVPLERYFPQVHGFVATDLGDGLCLDFLTGSDGQPPISLLAYMNGTRPPGVEPALLLDRVAEFAGFCRKHAILASCDEPRNIGLVRDGEGYRLVAYDLKIRDAKEFIPLSSYFAPLRRRKVARRFDRRMAQLRSRLASG